MYEILAVNALQARLIANLAAAITWVEDEEGIANGTIPVPKAYDSRNIQGAFIPTDDQIGPHWEVWDASNTHPVDDAAGVRNRLAEVPCAVAIKYTGGGDVELNEKNMRRLIAATRRAAQVDINGNTDHRLTDRIKCWWARGDRSYPFIDSSTRRSSRTIDFTVHVHHPI